MYALNIYRDTLVVPVPGRQRDASPQGLPVSLAMWRAPEQSGILKKGWIVLRDQWLRWPVLHKDVHTCVRVLVPAEV